MVPEQEQEVLPSITCSCGFVVKGRDEARNQYALEEHDCPNEQLAEEQWYHYVFSFWTLAIVVAIGYVILRLAGVDPRP